MCHEIGSSGWLQLEEFEVRIGPCPLLDDQRVPERDS
jgi:hypothetical protein